MGVIKIGDIVGRVRAHGTTLGVVADVYGHDDWNIGVKWLSDGGIRHYNQAELQRFVATFGGPCRTQEDT